MGSVGIGIKRVIQDVDGEVATVTGNRLDVNAYLSATPEIDIGDVSLLLGGTAASTNAGTMDAQTLRVTLATDDTHFGAVGASADKEAGVHAQLHYIGNTTGSLQTELESIDTALGSIYTLQIAQSVLTGAQYSEGEYHTSGIVRNDTLASLVSVDNDYSVLQVNALGALYTTGESLHDSAITDYGFGIMAEAKSIDGSALPNSTAEGDAIRIAATRGGVLYSHLSSANGQKTPIIDDDDGQVATPSMINVGGEYRSGDTTYGDGDATILQTNVNGALKVVGTVDLGSTDNAVLDAIAASLEILDDWDDSNYANVNINLAGSDAPTGGGAESGALRVTLANDSTGVISIDDGGNTITVDGTVTANLGTTDNAVLDAIAASLALLDNSIASGNELQVDVVTLPASTNTIEIVGDVAENENAAGNPVLIGGRYDSSARTLGNTDVGALALNASGHVLIDVVDGGVLESALDGVEALLGFLAIIDNDTSALATTVSGTELQVDVVAALPAGTNAVGKVGHDITAILSDDNPSVGTSAEKISGADGDVACKRIDIMAHPDNTGYIWVGDSAVSVDGFNGGIRLSPGDFYSMDIDNTGDVYAIATVADENVCFNYFT